MKIATWNINSLNIRKQHVLDWLEQSWTDVLCLQELKLTNEKFPYTDFKEAGYNCWFLGQKKYNGVAIVARDTFLFENLDIIRNIPSFFDLQQRLIAVTINDIRIISAYFPNGQDKNSDKFVYKMKWINALQTWLRRELQRYPKLALLGDYNIAPEDQDVHDPEKWKNHNMVSSEERWHFKELLQLGLVDVFRNFEQPKKLFTWWDYRMSSFHRNAGLRIDHILLSKALAKTCTVCEIDCQTRKCKKPSDHAPVFAIISSE
ncbi:MAG: exodeoxyribonuclease III [Burkholderia sp.]|nr:exodeoxyribonuclease III [Burkholderia sp.]